MNPHHSSSTFLLRAVLVALPILFFAVYGGLNFSRVPGCSDNLDRELLELSVLQASQGKALTGPYSRFEFRHPGPIMFYWLAAFEKTVPSETNQQAFWTATLVWNGLCLALAILLAERFLRTGFASLLILPITLWAVHSDRAFLLADYWNPYLIPTLFILFLVLSVGVSLRHWWVIPPWLFVASSAIQCHIGVLSGVAPVLAATAAAVILFPADRFPSPRVRAWRLAALTPGLLLLAWLGPLADALRSEGAGNLGRLWVFFRSTEPANSPGDALSLVLSFTGKFIPVRDPGWRLAGFLLMLLLPCALAGKRPALGRLHVFLVCASLGAFWGATRIVGPLHRYLISYHYGTLSLLLLLDLLALGVIASRLAGWLRLQPRSRRILSAVACATLLLGGVISAWPPAPRARACRSVETFQKYAEALKPSRNTLYRLVFSSERDYHFFAKLALMLIRSGNSVCVPDDWLYRFGEALDCRRALSDGTFTDLVGISIREANATTFRRLHGQYSGRRGVLRWGELQSEFSSEESAPRISGAHKL